MTETVLVNTAETTTAINKTLKRRHAAEIRFKLYGMFAIGTALAMLVVLLGSILWNGVGAFQQTRITIPVHFAEESIDPEGTRDPEVLRRADYEFLLRNTMAEYFQPDGRNERRELFRMIGEGAQLALRDAVMENPSIIGTTQDISIIAADRVDQIVKGRTDRTAQADRRTITDAQLGWIERLESEGRIVTVFNADFFTNGDSSQPEAAGIWGAVVGSFFTMIVTLILSFPLAVGAAVYLEEFAPKNRWTDLIEVNINNLAAVPSIVFGLLGLAVFLSVFGLPRSAPLVGGMVLALMTLPTIIISTRAALKAVPPSIREAAYGLGASQMQVVTHHVLPLAMPGIMTGTIIGMAQALGETAPLLMIGMFAFIVDVPGSPLDPASALPVQIYSWAGKPELGFVEKTSAAIMVLLAFLIVMNALAVLLRKRFERRW